MAGDSPARADGFSGQGHSAKVVSYKYGSDWPNIHSGLIEIVLSIGELPHRILVQQNGTSETETGLHLFSSVN